MQNYKSFVLRIWESSETGVWRATVSNPETGERRVFVTIESLFAFLGSQSGAVTVVEDESGDAAAYEDEQSAPDE